MVKINIILAVLVVLSSLFLVNIQHDSRLAFAALSHENIIHSELEAEQRQLLLDHQNLVTPSRIAQDAKNILNMYTPQLDVTEYVPKDPHALQTLEVKVPANVHFIDAGGGAHE